MASLFDRISLGIGKEVAIHQVLKALTWKRSWNAAQTLSSFALSAITKKHIVWGLPAIVNIEPTNICNLRCPLCITGSGQMERHKGKMNFTHYKKFVDAIADTAIYITLYHQGEPYLHKDFNAMVRYAKDKGVYVNTSTNAHYFDMETALDVVRSGLDSMIISLDGVTEETYTHYRRNGHLQTVLDGIRNVVAAKKQLRSKTPYLFAQFLVMQHNEHEIPAIKNLAQELEVDRLLIKTTQVMNLHEAKEWLPKNEKYRRYDVQEESFAIKQGTGACPRLWLTTLVDWDGQIVPCCFDKNGKYAMGHFADGLDFVEIWQSGKYKAFRRRMLADRASIDICRNCNYGIGLFK